MLTPVELSKALGGITVNGVYKSLERANINLIKTKTGRKRIPHLELRKFLINKGYKYPKLNISFQIVKGGVGKTSISYALANRASHYGAKILVVDLDQQGNLTRSFDIEARKYPVLLDVIRDNVDIKKSIINISDTLDLLPSNLNNSRLDVELIQTTNNVSTLLRKLLIPIRDSYDLVIFDCPPAINKINFSASCASDLIIIPLNPDPYSIDGLELTLSELKKIKKEFGANFDYKILLNRYDGRERLGAYYMRDLIKDEEKLKHIMPVVIRVDTSLKNAIFEAKSIFELKQKSVVKEDIEQLTLEILGINKWRNNFIRD